jgi:outer membrane protein assembly factor BamB
MPVCLTWVLSLALVAGPVQTANWPAFRAGATGGAAEGSGLPDTWDTSRNVVWKTDIPGRGWSSPVVWGDRIYLTSAVADAPGEMPKKGLYFGGNRPKPPTDIHHWMVYCLDRETGKVVWQREAHKGVPATPNHLKNTYASETPVTDGERVYVYFGSIGVFCYDRDGKEVWSQRVEPLPMALGWGTASSPVLYKDRLYLQNDNEKHSYLAALDARTGKELWRVDRDEKSTWATPCIWENRQRTELVTCGSKKVRSYALDGKLLWELGPMSKIAIPTPVASPELVYVSSGYVMDSTKPVYAVRPGGSGDLSLPKDATSSTFIAWSRPKAGPYNPSPLLYGDYLYVLYDLGVLACFEARTGKEVYKERLGPANSFTASPWACDGKVYCLSEDGDTIVVQAGPQFKVLGTNRLSEMCMASPAASQGSLFVRTLTKLYRIDRGGAERRVAR